MWEKVFHATTNKTKTKVAIEIQEISRLHNKEN